MQGQRGTIDSFPEPLVFEHGSTSTELIDQQNFWENNLDNSPSNQLLDYISLDSPEQEDQNVNIWNVGEPSSGAGPSHSDPRQDRVLSLGDHGSSSSSSFSDPFAQSSDPFDPSSDLNDQRLSRKRKAVESSTGQSSSGVGSSSTFQRADSGSSSWHENPPWDPPIPQLGLNHSGNVNSRMLPSHQRVHDFLHPNNNNRELDNPSLRLDPRGEGSSSNQDRPVLRIPFLRRNFESTSRWSRSSGSRHARSSNLVISEDRNRNELDSISDHPLFASPTNVLNDDDQNEPNWIPNGGVTTSRDHPRRRLSEYLRRNLLSAADSEVDGGQIDNLLRRNRAVLGNSSSSSRDNVIPPAVGVEGHHHDHDDHHDHNHNHNHHQSHSRSSLLLDRHFDGAFRSLHHSRSVTPRIEGRGRLVTEIRSVLDSMRRGEPLRFEDLMVLDQSVFHGISDIHDRHRDMMLDVDNMSYEELLALEERIGNVNVGLTEETIMKHLKHKQYVPETGLATEPCCICQGIVVVCAAGNGGPEPSSIYNGAPWITTVGAGTIDRSYVATVELENGQLFEGISCFPASVLIQGTSLYYGSNDSNKSGCKYGSLDRDEVKRKIVLCDDSNNLDIHEQMETVKSAGAYGAIFLSESFELEPEDYYIPGVVLHTRYAKVLKEYAMAGNGRVKNLRFGLTKTGTGPAPQVAQFSSRGPNPISPQVLKPDILAPGVNVLGAVRPDDPFMQVNNYGLLTDYAFKSGTSMAAPHVAGVATLVRAVHRDWSPAAIRSAIMTTATKTDNTHGTILDQQNGMAASPLDFGAGHVNPNRAMDPGLIYDMGSQDYIDFLCGLGYTRNQMMTIIRTDKWICNENQTELNYPSFILNLTNQTKVPFEQHFTRTVTNVGDLTSTYHAILTVPDGLIVSVEPNTLWFTSKSQKAKFVLTVRIYRMAREVNYGYLEWVSDRNQSVSSPIVIVTDSGS